MISIENKLVGKKKIDFFNFKKANDPYINIEVNLFSQVYFKNSLRKI